MLIIKSIANCTFIRYATKLDFYFLLYFNFYKTFVFKLMELNKLISNVRHGHGSRETK